MLRRPASSLLVGRRRQLPSLVAFGGGGIRHLYTATSVQRMRLPSDQSKFAEYQEIDLPSESRIESMRKIAGPKDIWVGLEKVHGANFGVYLIDEKDMRYAKRSGIMDPNENFFGYHLLAAEQFPTHAKKVLERLKAKLKVDCIKKLVLHGELFGCKYDHPKVPKTSKWYKMPNGATFPLNRITIQEEPFPQYSPDIHFYCFDIKYSITGEDKDHKILPYDDFVEICDGVDGFLYARAVIRGTLDQCLAFDIENFQTPLPAQLGMGNYPLKNNWAEGIIVRHVNKGTNLIPADCCSMLKIRCSAFMELKHPEKQKELKLTFIDTVREAAVRKVGQQAGIAANLLPKVEAAANGLLLNYVSEGRLSNVISKFGRDALKDGTVTQQDVTLKLARDALKDFLKELDDPMVLNMNYTFRTMLIRNCYWEADSLVKQQWAKWTK